MYTRKIFLDQELISYFATHLVKVKVYTVPDLDLPTRGRDGRLSWPCSSSFCCCCCCSRLRRFKLSRDEIWQDCSSSKYASDFW